MGESSPQKMNLLFLHEEDNQQEFMLSFEYWSFSTCVSSVAKMWKVFMAL